MEYNITYRQKDKGWQYIISYKVNGNWKQKSKQGFKTKKDAKPHAEKTLLQLKLEQSNKNNILKADYNIVTFKEVKEKSLEHEKLYKEPNTLRTYTTCINAFSDLYDKPIETIKKADIQSIIDKLVKNNRKYTTLKRYLIGLSTVFKYYKNNYNLNYKTPVENIILPKEEDATKRALTRKELENVLFTFKQKINMPYQHIICLIASTCGLRYSEILGLTWEDIDEVNLTISVNKQWKRRKDGIWTFGKVKSKNSKRIIPLPESTLKELKKYKKENPTDTNNRIIIKDAEVCRVTLNLNLNKIANISIHELRHTYATFLISNGLDFKTTANLLGHDVRETLKTYSHVTNDMLENAKKKILNIF